VNLIWKVGDFKFSTLSDVGLN